MNYEKTLHHPGLILFCRLLLALVFIGSALGKILDIPGFIEAMSAYRLLPEPLTVPFGHFLPWLEFMTGLCLLIGHWQKGAVLLAGLMLSLFIIVILITLARGIEIECGCFSFLEEDSLQNALVRDLILLLPVLALYRRPRKESRPNEVDS